jgi:hypothetical protein
MTRRGFAELSPPEAQHALLELPTNRAEYVGVLQDLGDYPARSPIGARLPTPEEVNQLKRAGGRWRAVTLLDDDAAISQSACLFERVFVLDPLYDPGALLYAAWHDPFIRDEHSRRLAEQASRLVRLAPLLNDGTAILAPDHLPGSWSPRPGWRQPRRGDHPRQLAAWSMRAALVLSYWADHLDAVVCATRADVLAGLHVVLGAQPRIATLELGAAPAAEAILAWRQDNADSLCQLWTELRRVSRRRPADCVGALALAAQDLPLDSPRQAWQLALGTPSLPEPAMLIRRILNGQDPEREPPLPRKRLKRRPLCLLGAATNSTLTPQPPSPYPGRGGQGGSG